MAFKGKATVGSSLESTTKTYMWVKNTVGNGIQEWIYVTADPLATVDGSGYIDDQDFIDVLRVGDPIYIYVVDSIDDTRSIQADLAAGLADYGKSIVVENTGTVVDLSPDVYDASGITYGD